MHNTSGCCHFVCNSVESCCVFMQVYNDADILEKILKDKRKELGSPPEEDDVGSPKVKLSMSAYCFKYMFQPVF